MKWMRYRHAGVMGFGQLSTDGEQVQPCSGDMFGTAVPIGAPIAVNEVEWCTPCAPRLMLALWNNFRASAEKNGWAEPAEPLYFVKTPNSYAAHRQAIPKPRSYDGRVVYEGELAIVIGRSTRAVSVADAPAHIFGYTCANDITAVELFERDPSFAQWTRAKGFDGFGVFGPVISTEVDLSTAHVRTTVGGRERQNYPVADMFFNPAELVSRISQDISLEAGDVILCGTSLGVLPMKPGTVVDVSIDGIGSLSVVYG